MATDSQVRWREEFEPTPTVPLRVHEATVRHMLQCIYEQSYNAALDVGERALGINTEDQREELYRG